MLQIPPFVKFILQRSRSMVWIMVCAGVLSGVLSAGVLALINHVLHHGEEHRLLLALGFAGAVGGRIVVQFASQLLLTHFSQDTTLELSLTLCDKILKASLRKAEQRGLSNMLVTLSEDVTALTWAIQSLPQLAMNAAIVVGCGLYLAWLSWPTFLLVVMATVLGAVGYQWLHSRAFKVIYEARAARAQLFRHFRSLTEGLKELLMHRDRRREFVEQEVRIAAECYRQTNTEAAKQYAMAEAWTYLMFFSLMGLLLFAFPRMLALSSESLIGYVVVLLYMMSPIWGIIGALPAVGKGQVALENIEQLGISLDGPAWGPDLSAVSVPAITEGAAIALQDVRFTYDPEKEGREIFTLGPISCEINPGELVFVIGGNGSGKSTFVKVLAGLYVPQQGEIRLGGTTVTDKNREWYRGHYSVVFADFFLFNKLLGIHGPGIDARARTYVSLLAMDRKVEVHERTFSTIDLSQGQRKRLALVTAYLEDRSIYIFDEWAADQDPQYKEIFYLKLLPDLRARGKTVVVITHDDRYFHLGDRVIKLESGKIVG
jgi:putative ATP-binding cassette transporter